MSQYRKGSPFHSNLIEVVMPAGLPARAPLASVPRSRDCDGRGLLARRISRPVGRFAAAIAFLSIWATALHAETKYVDFPFTQVGTQLNALTNGVTTPPFASLKWNFGSFSTDTDGTLNIGATRFYKGPNPNLPSNGGTVATNPPGQIFRTLVFPLALTNGEIILRYTVSEWNLGGTNNAGATGNGLYINAMSATSGANGIGLKFEVAQAPGTDMRVQTQVLNFGAAGNTISGTAPAAGSVVPASGLVSGTQYVISEVGTADWTSLGAATGTAGTIFTATGRASSGTFGAAIRCLNATALVSNTVYQIKDLGDTSWPAVGAASPALNSIFTANGAGTGTGKVIELTRFPQDQLGDLNLINTNAPVPVTVELRANLSTGAWSTWVKAGADAWAPVMTDGEGLFSIARVQLANIASNGPWEYTSAEGQSAEYIKLDSLALVGIPQFALTLDPAPANGTVEGAGLYREGATATLTATPSAGYFFSGLTGEAGGTNNPLSVLMDGNKTIGANFSAVTHTLTIDPAPVNGTVEGAGTFNKGTTATLVAIPAADYFFSGWTGEASGTANPLNVTMSADKTIGASFEFDNRDVDGDGLFDRFETGTGLYRNDTDTGTDPARADSSGDGLLDGESVGAGLDPNTDYTPVLHRLRTRVGENQGDFNLYTKSALFDLNVGKIGLQRAGEVNDLAIQVQYKTDPDGTQWSFFGEVITSIVMPGPSGFIKVTILGPE